MPGWCGAGGRTRSGGGLTIKGGVALDTFLAGQGLVMGWAIGLGGAGVWDLAPCGSLVQCLLPAFQLFRGRSRVAAMLSVFIMSAIVHEYVITLCFGFFYPVMFTLFAIIGGERRLVPGFSVPRAKRGQMESALASPTPAHSSGQ